MSKLVTLDEVEAYEQELRRAHAENRAPSLRDPHKVYAENFGNAKHHLEEISESEQKSATEKLHKEQRDDLNQDKKLLKVIRDNHNKLSDGEGSVTPYQAPDPKRFNPPKTADEKQAVADKVQADYERNRSFDDSYSDSNIPNTTDDDEVKGDSVNRVLTRKMSTFSPDEIVREDEKNSVPVPERFRQENPPLVIQQDNPITGEKVEPEKTGYVDGYVSNLSDDDDSTFDSSDVEVPLTAITTPWPEHVIGDETGTTREQTNYKVSDVSEAEDEPDFPETVPLSEGQVAQGAVKRPEYFDPPENPSPDISQINVAGTAANLPVDTTGLRGENAANKASTEALEDTDKENE